MLSIRKIEDDKIKELYTDMKIRTNNYCNFVSLKEMYWVMHNKMTQSYVQQMTENFGKQTFCFDGEYNKKVWYLKAKQENKEMDVLVFTAEGFGTTYEFVKGDEELMIPFIAELQKFVTNKWIDAKNKKPIGEVLCQIQHLSTKGIVIEKLYRVKEDDVEWRTADDHSELSYDWNVIKYTKE